jgi:hypothetical protein
VIVIVPVAIAQVGCVTPAVGADGRGFTVMVVFPELANPLPSVTFKVYVVVAAGEAVGLAIVAELNPVDGDHK